MEVVRYFLRLGLLGFGGPVALVGQMGRELADERGWLTKDEMREAVAICQSLPGPLAIQVGIYISYLRAGFWGAWAGGWAFILPNFVIVAALGALYVYLGDLKPVTAIFYGVSPAVIALILHSCWRLAKLGMEDWLQWAIAAVCFVVTIALRAEVALLFIGAGAVGILYYGTPLGLLRRRTTLALAAPLAVTLPTAPVASLSILTQLTLFFLKAGSLTFGSGLVIVPFLEQGLVREYGWVDQRQFLIAVAIGMISPGPVVITATFVGYLVAGFWGSLVSTVGIFLPSFVLVLIAAPLLARHRANPNVQGFVKGAFGAAIGTILGACVLLGRIAIGDWLTALMGLASLAVLFRWKVSNPVLIAAAAVVGLIAFPLLQPAHGQAVQLELEKTITLSNVTGRIDHLAADVPHQRLFVAELGNGSVDRIDLSSGEKRRIGGLKEPQGVAYLPDHNELVVASAGDGTVRFFDASSLTPNGSMTLGDDADNVRVDPKTGQVVVGYGSGALAILDPVRRAVVRTIELGAHPEGFQIDGEGRKAFVNVPNAHKIAAVDLDSGRVLANWRAAHLANFPMALGQDSGIVGMVYRIPARLVALEAASGAAKADLPTCDDADDLFFDDKRRRIYVSCGSGAIDVFDVAGDSYVASAHIETRAGARTSLFVPALDRLFVAARAGSGGQDAAILVYRPAP